MATHQANDASRRFTLEVLGIIASLAFVLLAWTTFDARAAAKQSAESSRGSAEAVAQLTEILNRRAPTLEYLGCHDRAADAVDLAYNDLVNALLDADAAEASGDQALIDETLETAAAARSAYDTASDRLEASTNPNTPPIPKARRSPTAATVARPCRSRRARALSPPLRTMIPNGPRSS